MPDTSPRRGPFRIMTEMDHQLRRERRRGPALLPGPAVSRFHRPRLQRGASPILLFLALVCFSTLAAATTNAAAATPAPTTLAPAIPAETLAVDTRLPVNYQGHWTMLSNEAQELRRRKPQDQGSAGSVTTTFGIAISTVTQKSKTTTVPASPLPSPLDNNLVSNFTGNDNPSCPTFINTMLTDPTFKQCYPLSLLLQGSTSFFEAEKSLVSITQVLDAACSSNVTFCSTYLAEMGRNLTSASNCGADYQLGNSVVVQTYIALLSYQTVYSSTCLKDPETSMYCFANAVTNLTTPSNVYFYFLPLNMSLPASSIPACGWCLQQSMAIYQASAANRKQPIAYTYPSAAQQVNTICGPEFVNETLPAATVMNGAPSSLSAGPSSWILLAAALGAAVHLIL